MQREGPRAPALLAERAIVLAGGAGGNRGAAIALMRIGSVFNDRLEYEKTAVHCQNE